MKLQLEKTGDSLIIKIEGNVDTVTAPELEKELNANWDGVKELILDFSGVGYISSAGLRAVMVADRHMKGASGKSIIRNVNKDVMDVFEMTGFTTILNIE